jgi:MerR family transcriptional regulator, copper efflux regulator
MDNHDERADIIKNLCKYKFSLEKERPELLDELSAYYPKEEENTNHHKGLRVVENVRYENPYEAYLTAQIQLGDALIPILDQHITLIKDGTDLDLVLQSLEHSIYRVKKKTYTDVDDWKLLLDHLPKDRLEKIERNPKGFGDLLLKELNWLRKYEARWKGNGSLKK